MKPYLTEILQKDITGIDACADRTQYMDVGERHEALASQLQLTPHWAARSPSMRIRAYCLNNKSENVCNAAWKQSEDQDNGRCRRPCAGSGTNLIWILITVCTIIQDISRLLTERLEMIPIMKKCTYLTCTRPCSHCFRLWWDICSQNSTGVARQEIFGLKVPRVGNVYIWPVPDPALIVLTLYFPQWIYLLPIICS